MNDQTNFDAMFSGIIGREYEMLKQICPYAVEMSRMVGDRVADYCQPRTDTVEILELGGGTGITTLAILAAADNIRVLSVDNEPTMQNQARQSLGDWAAADRLNFCGNDALTALLDIADNSFDVLASAYTLHNFSADYREAVLSESFRVLKPGGRFINGDRYALDDIVGHTRHTQQEIAGYFKVLTGMNRLDLLEQWIIHLFNDESANHIMRERTAVQQMEAAGFSAVEIIHRMHVNALLVAEKPLPKQSSLP